jgi:hypothetical protein
MSRASNGMHLRDNEKVIAVTNLCPSDFEVLLRLSRGRFRVVQQNVRRRASEAHDVWVEGAVTVPQLNSLFIQNMDFPGSVRVREVV